MSSCRPTEISIGNSERWEANDPSDHCLPHQNSPSPTRPLPDPSTVIPPPAIPVEAPPMPMPLLASYSTFITLSLTVQLEALKASGACAIDE